jgi:hypothetical protein
METMEGDWSLKCRRCGKRPASTPIVDNKTGEELWICDECDKDLFDARTLQDRMVRESDVHNKHHQEEGNEPAVRACAISGMSYSKNKGGGQNMRFRFLVVGADDRACIEEVEAESLDGAMSRLMRYRDRSTTGFS